MEGRDSENNVWSRRRMSNVNNLDILQFVKDLDRINFKGRSRVEEGEKSREDDE